MQHSYAVANRDFQSLVVSGAAGLESQTEAIIPFTQCLRKPEQRPHVCKAVGLKSMTHFPACCHANIPD